MTPEKWINTVNNIKDKFPVKKEGSSFLDEEGGIDIKFIEFDGPIGRMRLEFISKPIVIDKKTKYSKRIGSETQVDYIYSTEEKSYKIAAYKWNDYENDWEEIDGAMFDD